MSTLVQQAANEKFEITLPKKGDQSTLKNIVKKLGSINNSIANIVDDDEAAAKRLKEIKAQKKELCKKLLKEEKELKLKTRANSEKRLLMLGERESYKNLLTEYGAKIKTQELSEVSTNLRDQKTDRIAEEISKAYDLKYRKGNNN